jgi:hypothetical protein
MKLAHMFALCDADHGTSRPGIGISPHNHIDTTPASAAIYKTVAQLNFVHSDTLNLIQRK